MSSTKSSDNVKEFPPGTAVAHGWQPGCYGIVVATEPEPEIDEEGAIVIHGDARLVMWSMPPRMMVRSPIKRIREPGNLRWHRVSDLRAADTVARGVIRIKDNDGAIEHFGGFHEHFTTQGIPDPC